MAQALGEVEDNIYKKLDNQEIGLGIHLDLEKASNTVSHEILFHKMYTFMNE
jgi:hypothetical protein